MRKRVSGQFAGRQFLILRLLPPSTSSLPLVPPIETRKVVLLLRGAGAGSLLSLQWVLAPALALAAAVAPAPALALASALAPLIQDRFQMAVMIRGRFLGKCEYKTLGPRSECGARGYPVHFPHLGSMMFGVYGLSSV